MKNKQIAKYNMLVDVSSVLTSNKVKFSDVVELRKSIETLATQVKELTYLKKEQEKDLTYLSVKKLKLRNEVIKETVPVANIIMAFSYDIKDSSNIKKVNISKNKLVKAKDREVIEKCNSVLKVSRKLFATVASLEDKKNSKTKNITDYGLNGLMIDELELEVISYQNVLKDQANAISYRVKCTNKIANLLKDTEKLLKNKIGLLMTIFETKDSNLYLKFKAARVITKETPKEQQTVVVAKVAKKPVPVSKKATIAIKSKSAITSASRIAVTKITKPITEISKIVPSSNNSKSLVSAKINSKLKLEQKPTSKNLEQKK